MLGNPNIAAFNSAKKSRRLLLIILSIDFLGLQRVLTFSFMNKVGNYLLVTSDVYRLRDTYYSLNHGQ